MNIIYSKYRPKKGHDEYFSVPVLDRFVSISTGLVPEPALCPGAGAAERFQETLDKRLLQKSVCALSRFCYLAYPLPALIANRRKLWY